LRIEHETVNTILGHHWPTPPFTIKINNLVDSFLYY